MTVRTSEERTIWVETQKSLHVFRTIAETRVSSQICFRHCPAVALKSAARITIRIFRAARTKMMNAFQRWLNVFGGFICYLLADGFTYSFGIIYSYFITTFGLSGSSSAVLPGLIYSVPQFCAVFVCPLLDTYGYSSGAAWGSLLLGVSCFASSFTNDVAVLYFTFGALATLGLQLIYSSAIMSVSASFENDRFFGLAVGLTMCGSGIGSLSSNPLIAQLLASLGWNGTMMLLSAILLHSLISAACFHHVDADRFQTSQFKVTDSTRRRSLPDDSTHATCETCSPAKFTRYILLLPSRYRFHTDFSELGPPEPTLPIIPSSESNSRVAADKSGCTEFRTALLYSMKQIFSGHLWRNRTYLVYVLANGLAGAGVVVPWTFVYDHALLSLSSDDGLDKRNRELISWLPSAIGMGALLGNILFGLLTTTLDGFKVSRCCASSLTIHIPSFRRLWSTKSRRHLLLFLLVLLLNSLATFSLAFSPLSTLAPHISVEVSFLTFSWGQIVLVTCFLLGVTYGALYVLYPEILLGTVGKELWPAALGLFLFFNGSMNLAGTTIGGRLFDATGTYQISFVFAACIPLVGLILLLVQQNSQSCGHLQHPPLETDAE